ncbi:crossover junction endonuclease MUS81 isoform X2 [Aegilops tauschii subsp. strangulata]|uniref:Crossover junction endonuclease MUS81 n=1 Tax=Aegilops tauschii subsp. strangulata TaxID=200361 RepID=A0A453ER03_AEGTS|nr:crossover junction endonuclease MUS81 isoform X2 [Aegilops tauschii subsp. strangulata]XP_044356523.1 crossover junction endonuclease MUS81-like isoform X2 [Triticum aestivum]
MAPAMPKQRAVHLPDNEEVARLLLEKHRSMLEKDIPDNLSLTLSNAYRNVCAAKEPIRTLKDLLKIKGVGPWVIRLIKESFPASSPDLSPPKCKEKGEKGKKIKIPEHSPELVCSNSASIASQELIQLTSQEQLSYSSEVQTTGSAEFTMLDKDTGGMGNSILAMPPRLSNEKFLEAYEVVLILDDREIFGSRGKRVVGNIHSKFHVPVEIKRLPVGDGIWIARHRRSHTEYVLDFIVERKSVTDLVSSIRDSRYKDQKLRLKKCGLRKLIYLVEGDPNPLGASESIKTACFTTEILEGFDVQRTTGYSDTESTYGHLTLSIIDYYSTNFSIGANTCRVCLTYDEFVKKCCDPKKLTVSDIFALQLMQVPQVTEETAIAVIELYPTLVSLARAYSMLMGYNLVFELKLAPVMFIRMVIPLPKRRC